MKYRDNIPKKYQSKIIMVGYLEAHDDHKARLELDFENGMKLNIYDVPKNEYQKFNSCPKGWEYYFADTIYPFYKDQIEMVKN
ncbi:hypothetical protein Q5113_05620 [Acinetobacter pittii]|uniref:hypothetical protein n=1 Tax=Acinetobacter pittii TaxID=48296 RepID=UPI00270FA25A|nr:hypothetical protein [Acinetobacter pittii]MDO7535042.1 hypothetical protein [Acinetobacter pittii]